MKANFEKCTIELSAKEMKQASIPHTPEYQELLRVMRDLPGFSITVKHPRITHNANRGLTLKYMMEYITQNAPEKLEEFKTVCKYGGYPTTRKWFRNTFPAHS